MASIDSRLPLPPTIKDYTYTESFLDQSGNDNGGNDTLDTLGIIVDPGGTNTPDPATTPMANNPVAAPTGIRIVQQNVSQGADGTAQIQLVLDVSGTALDMDYEVRVVAL